MPLFPPIWFAGCLLVAIAPASLEFLQFTRPCAAMLAACSSNTFFRDGLSCCGRTRASEDYSKESVIPLCMRLACLFCLRRHGGRVA